MTKYDIEYKINSFSEAAYIYKLARFDVIQIHGFHGYLLSQFSDQYYKRK